MQILKIGISPCPNDTFIFEHIYNITFSIDDVQLEFIFKDVQELNILAQQQELDIVKVSYANYFNIEANYNLLQCGGAMGFGVGPLLVNKTDNTFSAQFAKVAIPGVNTTANFLLQFLFPKVTNKTEMLFSDIEDAILQGKVDAGLLIHENRFTYAQRGLNKIADLGEEWQAKTNLPIPLGCIAVKKSIPQVIVDSLETNIRSSILKSKTTYPLISSFVKEYAQEMQEDVIRQHIDLYVNDFSLHIGESGLQAVEKMREVLLGNLK